MSAPTTKATPVRSHQFSFRFYIFNQSVAVFLSRPIYFICCFASLLHWTSRAPPFEIYVKWISIGGIAVSFFLLAEIVAKRKRKRKRRMEKNKNQTQLFIFSSWSTLHSFRTAWELYVEHRRGLLLWTVLLIELSARDFVFLWCNKNKDSPSKVDGKKAEKVRWNSDRREEPGSASSTQPGIIRVVKARKKEILKSIIFERIKWLAS